MACICRSRGPTPFLKRRFRAQLSREDLYLLIRTQDRFLVKIEAGQRGQLTSIWQCRIGLWEIRALPGPRLHDHREGGNLSFGEAHHQPSTRNFHERRTSGWGWCRGIPNYSSIQRSLELPEEIFASFYHYTSWALHPEQSFAPDLFSRSNVMQRSYLYDQACSLGSGGERSRSTKQTGRFCIAID